ncbi:GNAT family N-acetyltransferase [Siphonobacter sp. BAB-5385]|nr:MULTISPECIES: GNAT family N-acetyltransferase [Siphonobacter]OZI05828.1 GNAT family N-acetyltransferase [Siphonobacter sp. BAB-5385]
MPYSITPLQPHEPLPMDLLLLADENPQLIREYLPLSQVYLLKLEGQTQGVGLLQVQEQEAEIINLAIAPSYQGQGWGKTLLLHLIEVARQQGSPRVLIKTGNSSINQFALYQRVGFDLVDVRYNYFLEAYPQPIWENQIRCKHQLILELRF